MYYLLGGIIQQFTPIYKSENPVQVNCDLSLESRFSHTQPWRPDNFFSGDHFPFSPLLSQVTFQVAFIMIGFLMKVLKDVSPDDWENYVLAYDNMSVNHFSSVTTIVKIFIISRCNIDRLKLLKKPLALSDPFPEVWLKVSKIIGNIEIVI